MTAVPCRYVLFSGDHRTRANCQWQKMSCRISEFETDILSARITLWQFQNMHCLQHQPNRVTLHGDLCYDEVRQEGQAGACCSSVLAHAELKLSQMEIRSSAQPKRTRSVIAGAQKRPLAELSDTSNCLPNPSVGKRVKTRGAAGARDLRN